MWGDNRNWTFSLEEVLLWIMNWYFHQKWQFKVKMPWWICFRSTSFLLHKILIDRLELYGTTCGLLWCFYQLFGISFWRHPFIAEDWLVSKCCNAKFLQMRSGEQTNSPTSWMVWGWVHFWQIFILGWTVPLSVWGGGGGQFPSELWKTHHQTPMICTYTI